jgi:hypothetical protein
MIAMGTLWSTLRCIPLTGRILVAGVTVLAGVAHLLELVAGRS